MVLSGEKPQKVFAGFSGVLIRTAVALFLIIVVSVGFPYGPSWLLSSSERVGPTLTRTELQAFVAQAVAQQAPLQRKETQAATEEPAANLREEQMKDLARIARQLQYLEIAQNAAWGECNNRTK